MGDNDAVHVVAEPESPHNTTLYEAGKKLLVDSVEVGREFCKFMVGVATGAIPLYLALVGLVAGDDYHPTVTLGIALLVPTTMFLASATIFAFGYFPVRTELSLNLPDQIDTARKKTLSRRYRASQIGFSVFILGVVLALIAVAAILV